MNFEVGFATDIGMKRSNNQDSGACFPEMGLFIVADGMGGHKGGEVASKMSVDEIAATIKKDPKKSLAHPKEVLTEAIQNASRAIFTKSSNEPALQGMGTTTTTLYFTGDHLSVGHVGDSRCYLLHGDSIWQITRDHSLVQEKLRAGMITREQMKTDRMKNVITRSVGFDSHPQVDVYDYTPRAGDRLLLCSDGLSGLVNDDDILKIVAESSTAQTAVESLVQQANKNGGDDNVTALLVTISSGGST